MNIYRAAIALGLMAFISACGTRIDTSRNSSGVLATQTSADVLTSFGFEVSPQTVIVIVNAMGRSILVEGPKITDRFGNPVRQLLLPGEKISKVFNSYSRREVAYLALGISPDGNPTGEVEIRKFYLATRDSAVETWAIRRLPRPG